MAESELGVSDGSSPAANILLSTKHDNTMSEMNYMGCVIGSLRKTLPVTLEVKHLHPLRSIARNNQRPFEFLFDYCALRYHLLLEHNSSVEDCVEDKRLGDISSAINEDDVEKEEEEIARCLQHFWPFVAKDCEEHESTETGGAQTVKDRLMQKPFIKIQVKTLEDGRLHKLSHGAYINYPLSDPIENPYPDVRLFERDEVKVEREITTEVFIVNINNVQHCMKAARKEDLQRELKVLRKLPTHQNLIHLVGVVDAGQGKIDRMIFPFIIGKQLKDIESAAAKCKETWKAQMREAVTVLHDHNIVWGDAQPRNVMVEEKTNRVVLIDFAGGICTGWVDIELGNSKAGDLQGLCRLQKYVDEMATDPEKLGDEEC